MPYISYNGQLFQVTQSQYNSYTIGDPLPTGSILTSTPNVAAGGTVTNNDTSTTPILTPNTTNNTPGQSLTSTSAQAITPASTTTLQQDLQNVATVEAGGTVATPVLVTGLQQDLQNVAAAEQANTSATAVNPADTLSPGETIVNPTDVNTSATPVDPAVAQDLENGANAGTGTTNTGTGTSADNANALSNIQGLVKNAQNQQTIADQRKQINNGDWRVRLRLAPLSNYLYNAPQPGILQPLKVTDGIIFPYTPQIDTSYRANYESYDLTHSNYRGYFYKNSYVDAISVKAQFTAQDTNEANYLLAVITFLKSVTKMFYGQDTQRGAPPPLVYLSGFGDYQFREHACVVSAFQYSLPDNVDYIRAGSPNNVGLNLTSIRDRQSVATNSIFGSINRLAAAFLPKGGTMGAISPPTLGLNRPTYVPTKLDINLTLLPVQSRQQVSKQFSVKEFANGNLIKGGFW